MGSGKMLELKSELNLRPGLEDQIAGQVGRVLSAHQQMVRFCSSYCEDGGYSSSMRNDYRNFAINFNMRVMSE